ncbi:hypothetical protein GCM10016455_17850 [Aliiroseovarius zhejiangensis]|uniref:DUF2125 domain-containing protein n=1 Tax=Aliiroseovarius zhejiangensis TaxID=1632025 RepID=A0ABQ3IXS3_9RHOB|nr:DUF2125 domain-containing protein [Aliiroseovarius zhejiangensis]GHE97724.1 hypothetical protein GCM10016455_17850 [Aliiroseovarius zhejiangensis]
MRKLIVIALVLAGLWAGYWYIGARATERAFSTWVADRQTDGWVAEAGDISTRGFPNRFDTIFTDLELSDPNTGLSWVAPEFQILALSYKPHHVIAVWPGIQTIATPEQRIEISGSDLKGSIMVAPTPDLTLERSSIVLADVTMNSTAGWTSALERGQLATRQLDSGTHRHEIHFEAVNLIPASSFVQSLDADDLLPPVFEGVTLKANLDFSAPWDRTAIEKERPQITHINLSELKAKWGELELWLAGEVEVDTEGTPTGTVTVKARNWRQMIAIAQTSGALTPELASTVTGALQFVAGLSGDDTTLDVPLRLSDGRMFLGPIPIGTTPVIRIR